MTGTWGSVDSAGGLPRTRAALRFARRCHSGQYRATDGAPFIEHPLEVGCLLAGSGAADHVIAAGVLHDVLEKTTVTEAELHARFGPEVTSLVCAVSEDQSIKGYVKRKAALRQQAAGAGPDALFVFAADKLSKVRELRAAIAAGRGPRRTFRRITAPAASAQALQAHAGHP
ncbi:MAG: HD domain-containing protein [Solirubrobacteraceae bacterium]